MRVNTSPPSTYENSVFVPPKHVKMHFETLKETLTISLHVEIVPLLCPKESGLDLRTFSLKLSTGEKRKQLF